MVYISNYIVIKLFSNDVLNQMGP